MKFDVNDVKVTLLNVIVLPKTKLMMTEISIKKSQNLLFLINQ